MSLVSSNAAILGSPHRDVLEAPLPDTPESKLRLLDELKNRGKAAVSSRDWKNACLLYEKALSLSPDEAILHSNLSLCQFSMGMSEEARVSAATSVRLDPKFVKGYWRLGQACFQLKLYREALEAHQKGLVQDPTNKAIQKEIDKLKKIVLAAEEEMKLQKKLEAEKCTAAETSKAMEIDNQTTSPSKPKITSSTKKKSNTSSATVKIDDEVDFTKSDHVKGYKVVNGKKTSYFHNELSEEAKALIGDIAPKRLDSSTTPIADVSAPSGSSVWNKAGTWEEKDITNWAQESLEAALLAAEYTLADSSPAPGARCIITSAKSSGHASYATVRSKKRYIYEFAVNISWEFSFQNDKASGSMSFPDFDGTCELGQGYDIAEWSVKESSNSNLTPLLERFVRNGGLRNSLHDAMDNWVRHFRETY